MSRMVRVLFQSYSYSIIVHCIDNALTLLASFLETLAVALSVELYINNVLTLLASFLEILNRIAR